MRISDWSSDVCSSDRAAASHWVNEEVEAFKRLGRENRVLCLKVDEALDSDCFVPALLRHYDDAGDPTGQATEPLAADLADDAGGERKSVVSGKGGSVRGDRGGSRASKINNNKI